MDNVWDLLMTVDKDNIFQMDNVMMFKHYVKLIKELEENVLIVSLDSNSMLTGNVFKLNVKIDMFLIFMENVLESVISVRFMMKKELVFNVFQVILHQIQEIVFKFKDQHLVKPDNI